MWYVVRVQLKLIKIGNYSQTQQFIIIIIVAGHYVHGIPSPALLQFIRLGYGTGLTMAQ
jgi:hypothetical protein